MHEDNLTSEMKEALHLVNCTSNNLYITGKAGTGKTTLLKHMVANCHKNVAVVAPTGIAAINADGVTMHSLFCLPFHPYRPRIEGGMTHDALDKYRLNLEKYRYFGTWTY